MESYFKSYFMKNKFRKLYQVLLPALNLCNACGFTKCYSCEKFETNCTECKLIRCINCVKFQNSIHFFYIHTTIGQWSYVCNFLYDVFRLHDITRANFNDVSIPMMRSIS